MRWALWRAMSFLASGHALLIENERGARYRLDLQPER
jgi:hypothetical protein